MAVKVTQASGLQDGVHAGFRSGAKETMTEILAVLENSRQQFIAVSEGVLEAQAKTAPAPGRWSVLDCVEHVTIVEERFLGWLENGRKLDAPRIDPPIEARLAARVRDRATKVV